MKYIKLFEAFNSKLINKLGKFKALKSYIVSTLMEEDILVSNVEDIYEDDNLIEFTSAIDGYNKILDYSYLKFFINDISDLQFILHGDNKYKNKLRAGFSAITEDYVIFNTDFCLILNIDKIKEKYSGYEELKDKRASLSSGVFLDNSDVRRQNIERYEYKIFSKYGFFDDERNMTEGLRLFFDKVLSRISPIQLVLNDDFYRLFSYVKEYHINEEGDREESKKDIIKCAKRLLSCKILELEKVDDLIEIYHKPNMINSNTNRDEDIDYIFNKLLPLIKNFNNNFTFDKVLSDKIDLIVLSQQIYSMKSMINEVDGLSGFISTIDQFFENGQLEEDEDYLRVKIDNTFYYTSDKKYLLKKIDYTLKTFLRIIK